jgi:hypothetical protein
MPAVPILTTASTLQCPHAGSVMLSTANAMATADGAPMLLLTDLHTVSGCPFQIPIGTGTKPQPCVTVRWLVGAMQTMVNGTPVLLENSVGLCLSAEQIPQGPPRVVNVQQKAKGI